MRFESITDAITFMATLTIKNLPSDLYRQLKKSAEEHRRSINSEAIVCLEKALAYVQPDEEALMQRIRHLRETSPIYLTEAERRQAQEEGRT
jgi:antitoxin FitA